MFNQTLSCPWKASNWRALSNISKVQEIVETFPHRRKTIIRNLHLIAALTCKAVKHQSKSKTFQKTASWSQQYLDEIQYREKKIILRGKIIQMQLDYQPIKLDSWNLPSLERKRKLEIRGLCLLKSCCRDPGDHYPAECFKDIMNILSQN